MTDTTKELLQQHMAALTAEKAALAEQTAALHAQREAIIAEIAVKKAALEGVVEQIKAVEQPWMLELAREISLVAKALGAKSLGDNRG